MKRGLLCLFVLLFAKSFAQTTLQEKLGYKKEDKLLIIHADDLGMSHSEDAASTEALEHGSVSSASIMVPCPWFPEIASYAAAHPNADFGLHLTLTSEWKYYKWSTVAAKADVPGLTNDYGVMYSSVDSVLRRSHAKEVETELRAQIERAKQFGVDITHLDAHMGTLYSSPDYLNVMRKLGKEYKVPVMLNGLILAGNGATATPDDVLIDSIYIESPGDYSTGTHAFYTKLLTNIKPGVSLVILHAAHDDEEMKAITTGHPDYGAAWRQADYDFFTSLDCRKLVKDHKIHIITWREIRDRVVRK